MLEYSYYPFKNRLEDIDVSDMILLRDIAEGWYVDYKVQGLKIVDYAKHLSAFANQYGGWLIIGVGENPNGSRTALEFRGVPNIELEELSRNIREASSAHINPEVLYEEKIIEGPLEEIGLIEGRAVLIIGIPMSRNTPHIHSTGRIYRRLADQSKPREETDRYILDELWDRGKKYQDKMSTFLKKIPDLPLKQSESPWVHIYFKPADGQLGPSSKLTFSEFTQIVKNKNKDILGVLPPMQAISCTVDGFIARQISDNDPSLAALTIRWWNDGIARIDIPLNIFNLNTFMDTHKSNTYASDFCELAKKAGFSDLKIVDYSLLIQAVAALSNLYIHMLRSVDDKRDIYSCFCLRNIFQTSAYVDSKAFISRVVENSLPMNFDGVIYYPSEPIERTMIFHDREKRIADFTNYSECHSVPYAFSLSVIYEILRSVGVFSSFEDLSEDTEVWGFEKIKNVIV